MRNILLMKKCRMLMKPVLLSSIISIFVIKYPLKTKKILTPNAAFAKKPNIT